MSRPVEPISVELVLAGRELTEPRLSPDGRTVGVRAALGDPGGGDDRRRRRRTGADAHRVARPAAGALARRRVLRLARRRFGRGVRGRRRRAVAATARRAATSAHDVRAIVCRAGGRRRPARSWSPSVDEAEVWLVPIGADDAARAASTTAGTPSASTRRSRRRRRGVLAGVEPTRHAVGRGARVPARRRRSDGRSQRWRPDGGCGPAAPPHARRRAHMRARRLRLAERVRRRSSRCCRSGSSRRGPRGAWVCARTPWRPTSERVAVCRNELGFGRLTIVDVARPARLGRRLDRCRSWRPRPGLVGRRLDRGAALGCPDPDADRALRRGGVRTHGPRGRPRRRMGRDRPPRAGARRRGTRRHRRARSPVRARRGPPARAGCTAARRISGRSTSALASPTGGAAAGTCSWSIRGAPPATAAPISGR